MHRHLLSGAHPSQVDLGSDLRHDADVPDSCPARSDKIRLSPGGPTAEGKQGPLSKKLNDAWKDLRLNLRHAVLDHLPRHSGRLTGLSLEPPDPERIATFVKQVASDLEELAAGGEESPVLRLVKKVFKPNPVEKTRRRLVQAFDHYLATHNAESSSG